MRRQARSGPGLARAAGVLLAGVLAAAALAQDLGLPGKGGLGGAKGFDKFEGEVRTAEVEVRATPDRTKVRPGDQLAIAIEIDHLEGWHTWPAKEQDALPDQVAQFAIHTTIAADGPDWARVGPVQFPEPHEVPVADPMGGLEPAMLKTYSGVAVAYAPVLVDAGAAIGSHVLRLEVTYQACNDSMCIAPETATFELPIEVVGADASLGDADARIAALFDGFDPSVFAAIASGDVDAPRSGSDGAAGASGGSTFFGFSLEFLEGGPGLVLLVLLSAIGGAILNLTPCVLPVIPIKVMTLTKHAGNPGRAMFLGLWMAAGVVAFWVGISVPVLLFASVTDPTMLFGIWWVTGGIGLLLGLMALGLMGLFTLTLPQKAYMINPNAENASGSFLFGVMTGVLGLPCFGLVAGSLMAAAATWGPGITLAVFTGIGVGMAAPYLVLSAKPSLVSKVPKTGPASELVKQVMGLLLLAAAAYFIGSGVWAFVGGRSDWLAAMPWWAKTVHWWVIAALAFAAGAWLIIRTVPITKKPGRRLFFAVVGVVIGGVAVAFAADTTAKAADDFWTPYSEDALAEALASDRVVVVDFTAEWCLNCKALKAAVLHREPVKGELRGGGVVAMTADLTSTKAPGWDKLQALGQTGIPLLVIDGPGLDEPWMSNAYTSSQVMAALERARGGPVASRD